MLKLTEPQRRALAEVHRRGFRIACGAVIDGVLERLAKRGLVVLNIERSEKHDGAVLATWALTEAGRKEVIKD